MARTWSVLVAITFALGAHVRAAAPEPRSIPVVTPFAAQVKGTVLDLDIRVREERRYTFTLRLGFAKGNDESRRRIKRLVGDGARHSDGTPVDTGLPIPVELTIWRLPSSSAEPIYNKRLSEFELVAQGVDYYAKRIDGVWLVPGDYHVRLEALHDVAELEATPVQLVIAYRTK